MFHSIFDWLGNNYQWVFSGIGVVALGLISKSLLSKDTIAIKQEQRGGDGSINVQVARDLTLGDIKMGEREQSE